MPLIQPNQRYTYQDYLQWDDDERWELIDGIPYNMSPAPTTVHQQISLNVTTFLVNKLKGKKCIPFSAPTDIVFSEDDVVQPDVFVVCDKSKVEKRAIMGAPDLVIEIMSSYSSKRDRWDKKILYERNGVKEYLLIDQDGKYVEQYVLTDANSFSKGKVYAGEDAIPLHSIEHLELPLPVVFDLSALESVLEE